MARKIQRAWRKYRTRKLVNHYLVEFEKIRKMSGKRVNTENEEDDEESENSNFE